MARESIPVGPGARHSALLRDVIVDALLEPDERHRLGGSRNEDDRFSVVVELNKRHSGGEDGAAGCFEGLYYSYITDHARTSPERLSPSYYKCEVSINELRRLVLVDAVDRSPEERTIARVWPDFPIHPMIYRSISTVKADAARRSYDAFGEGITWAVLSSGVDASHPHFQTYDTLGGDVAELHRDFTTRRRPNPSAALRDGFGHGSYVAGIIAGALPSLLPDGVSLRIFSRRLDEDSPGSTRLVEDDSSFLDPDRISGIAPRCKLVSLKVLDEHGNGPQANVIRALEYIRRELTGEGRLQRVHGITIPMGYEFDPKWFPCGGSPLCVEVERLVRSGVVVVTSAGNTGYGSISSLSRTTNTGLLMTINDPGNAELAITVGSTHRESPHKYGVSYYSSKGPTADGRLKPDLVAPGEGIVSCSAGRWRKDALKVSDIPPGAAVYTADSGTSGASAHVSGAVAAFLSVHREFIGRPDEVKRIFLDSATSLGRRNEFQGHGLVDLMRALQSV